MTTSGVFCLDLRLPLTPATISSRSTVLCLPNALDLISLSSDSSWFWFGL